MRRLAFIPARGGSKRLPGKNIVEFHGKPIIAWTIKAALETDLFDKVLVSTDDQKIAEIAKSYGAEVDIRAPALASDTATVAEACLEYLDRAEAVDEKYDVLCCLYATAPLRTAEDITATVNMVVPEINDFAIAVTDFDFPAFQALRLEDNGSASAMWPDLLNKNSSEVGSLVVDNGSTYAVSVNAFRKEKEFLSDTMKVHVMPRERSHDIDEAVDLEIARFYAGRS